MDPPRPNFEALDADWLPVREALSRALASTRPLPTESVPVARAAGRALGESLVARATLPPWDNSAMDGYAVRAADVTGASPDTPVFLRVSRQVRAGQAPGEMLEPGHAVRIMTGAPVPGGADCVVPVEQTDAEAGELGIVEVRRDAHPGQNVRPGGQDMIAGEEVLSAGTTLTPGVLAVVAALGYATLPLTRCPRVAVLSSGDELRSVEAFDDVIDGRGVPEVNGPALLAAVQACGAEGVWLGVARDDDSDIRMKITGALEADLLLTSGGASMGEADLFKRVLETMGYTLDFWRVRMRPGSPFSLGRIYREGRGDLPVLGLPGNPASAFVTFQLFARPMILRLAGHRRAHRRVIAATAGEELRSTPRLTHFLRVVLTGPPGNRTANLAGHQGSGLVQSLGQADGLAVVPEGQTSIHMGEAVEVILLDDGPGASELVEYRPGLG